MRLRRPAQRLPSDRVALEQFASFTSPSATDVKSKRVREHKPILRAAYRAHLPANDTRKATTVKRRAVVGLGFAGADPVFVASYVNDRNDYRAFIYNGPSLADALAAVNRELAGHTGRRKPFLTREAFHRAFARVVYAQSELTDRP